jgi:hypothetical protein
MREATYEFTCMNNIENKTVPKEAGGGERIKENKCKKRKHITRHM